MEQLTKAFQNGVKEYGPAVMWFTSGNIDLAEMTRQLEGFREKGISDFYIHASAGTEGDYLGPCFFRMIRHAVAEAERLGLNFWIYDEYNWPSGVAGGKVLLQAPWAKNTVLSRKSCCVLPGQTGEIVLPEKHMWNTQCILCTADEDTVVAEISEDTVRWHNDSDREKTLEVYYTSWSLRKLDCTSNSEVIDEDALGYLDTMDEEAVQVFIRLTHEEYKRNIGQYFGKSVKGIFTDETVVIPQPKWETRQEMPWSRKLAEVFYKQHGYDILPKVKALMDRTDPQLMLDYRKTVSDMFMHAYMDQVQNWCRENGLIYTGHLLCEENIEITVNYSGDPYEYYKRFDMPGIDSILTYYFIDDYNFNITAKRASSAARFLHKKRLLCETFTVSGWEIRLRDMKRIMNRLYLLGVNYLQYMGAAYEFQPANTTGAMTNNWQNPLFRHYGDMSRYISAMQWLLSNSESDCSTLVLYPMTTANLKAPILPEMNWGSEMNDTLNGVVNSLLGLQIPFEFVFEQLVDEATIEPGCMVIDGCRFSRILLPCTTYLKEATFRKLQAFAQAGGKLIAVNGAPEQVIDKTVYAAPALPGLVEYNCREFETYGCGGQGNSGKTLPMGTFTQGLAKAIGPVEGIVTMTPRDGLYSTVRKLKDRFCVLLANDTGAVLPAEGEVAGDWGFRVIDTETGEQKAMEVKGRHFRLQLQPYESAVLEIAADIAVNSSLEFADWKRETLENGAFVPLHTNMALPEMHQVRGAAMEAMWQAGAVKNPGKVCALAENLQDTDLVLCGSEANRFLPNSKRDWFGWTPVDGKKPGRGENVVCVYDFTVDTLPPKLELVSDPQYGTRWYLNGQQLYQSETRRVWHYANPVFDLTNVVKAGKNRLVGMCSYPDYTRNFMLPCAVFQGDFRFFADKVITQKPGAQALNYWNDQGYLCYTGEGAYRTEFTLTKPGRVLLEMDTTDVVEVYVNGSFAGKRLWDPYRVELTDFVQPGKNELELRVTATLSNFLYNGTPSGIGALRILTE